MRRLLSCFFLIVLISIRACAESLCFCSQEQCLCFIQLGDKGPYVEYIQNALIAQGYLAAPADATIFDKHTAEAVIQFQEANALAPTGMMDDDTLTLLLWGMIPQELDAAKPESIGCMVWIPTDGGRRHHKRCICSSMFDPRMVSQRNALKMDMQACGRCDPDGFNTDLSFEVKRRQ